MSINADYNAESRTFTSQGQSASVQSWKKSRLSNDTQAALINISEEARTESTGIHVDRSFSDDLSKGSSDKRAGPRSFQTALNMADQTAASKPPSSDFSFDDFIDIINPLQHLPVVGMIYREITGDTIKPVAQIVGGGIFGGPIGAVSGTVNAVVQETTGKDLAGNVFALVTGGDDAATSETLADNAPASINSNNPEMALSLASAQYAGDNYVPAPAVAGQPSGSAVGFTANRNAAAAYAKTWTGEERTASLTPHQKELPPIDVDFTPVESAPGDWVSREIVTAMPIKPVYGGIY
jgi:hypothetical protein